MTYILVIWTIVAAGGTKAYARDFDWRPIGDFRTKQDCIEAAKTLSVDENRFRCLAKGNGFDAIRKGQ